MTITEENLATIARRYFDRNRSTHYGHLSHLAAEALEYAERVYNRFDGDSMFFGVEGSAEYDLLYLNTGDTYASTVCYHNGEFIVSSWVDIVEEENNRKDITS